MRRKQPRLLVWLLMMVFGSALCLGLAVLAIDQVCHSDAVDRQPIYPEAEIIETEFSFIRPRAIGFTRLTLSTDDDVETVRQWIRDQNLELLRQERFRGLSALNWRAAPDPDSDGSLLFYTSSCGE